MQAAASASTGLLDAVLRKLGKMLADEYELQTGAKDGIRYIRAELESMQAALAKVSEVPPEQLDNQVKLWAKKVRETSYSIEDTIDSFMLHVGHGDADDESGICACVRTISMLPWRYKSQRDLATEIKRIKEEVDEVGNRRERYKLDSIIVATAPSDPRLLALYEDKAKLVGIDHSTDEIIKLLSMEREGDGTSEQKLKLVSIVGPGGMGKTTLANAVYQKLEEKFDCTAFVSVSLQPDVKNILSGLLRQVTASKVKDDLEEDEGKDKDKKRYLIVIDDIWEEQPWKLIKCALFENKLGSKVITTTRNTEIAKLCSADEVDGIIHQLQPLSDGDSEQLLYYKIFKNEGCPTELKDVSQKILKKCKGWPLAINAIASLLANKPTQTQGQWYSVLNSISTGLENNHGVKDMRLILSLSYRDMPAQLRDCLLYLSIFPEDHIIGRDDLIQRWIAEDLVHGRQDDYLYELGNKYFNELINRSMIQPIDVDAFGRAQACKVHDLVLEYINSLSAEEDFVTIFNGLQSFPQSDSIHRLSLRNSEGEHGIPKAIKRLPHVRTLVVSSCFFYSTPSLSIFPVLRVLELQRCTESNIKGVENLVHLRYLRLTQAYYFFYDGDADHCINLPERIGNLQLLQTLDLKDAMIKELPHTVVQFSQLRVLEISLRKFDKRCETLLLQCLCNVKQLEALCINAPDLSLDFMLQVDWAPTHLRRFTASPREQSKHMLRSGWVELSPFSRLPRWINSSLLLSDLSIMVRTLAQEDLEILEVLPVLRSVDLEVIQATGTRLEFNGSVGGNGHATAFQCLGNLKFASRAVGLVFKPGAVQELQKLYLCFDVAETKDVHGDFDFHSLENIASLKTLDVDIDCRCARLWEVEAVEAALSNATKLNPNCPTLGLTRHFPDLILHDQEEEIPEHLQAKKKEDVRTILIFCNLCSFIFVLIFLFSFLIS
uniref:Putative RGH1A n=1 Tax=Oryza nivara TaxID=4536 RepID=A0A679BB80_ORYNI|nr:putative RGH1A [Oryza sativa f. spontanea]